MLTLNCPSCGAEVVFKSRASVFAVCTYCRSTLVRQDKDVSLTGKMSEWQDDLSPIQVGTVGHYDNSTFEILGRLRVAYEGGYWNEWYALFADNREGWLAEAQGFWAICLKAVPQAVPARKDIKPGFQANLTPHGHFVVEDCREVTCIFSEGELPMAANMGRCSFSVDMSDERGRHMATIEYAEGETRVFTGEYLDFDEFKFKHLRELDGW